MIGNELAGIQDFLSNDETESGQKGKDNIPVEALKAHVTISSIHSNCSEFLEVFYLDIYSLLNNWHFN